jgi:hypothetical protein
MSCPSGCRGRRAWNAVWRPGLKRRRPARCWRCRTAAPLSRRACRARRCATSARRGRGLWQPEVSWSKRAPLTHGAATPRR